MLLYVILFTEEMYRPVSEEPIVLYIDDSISHQKIQLIFSKKVREKFSYDPEKKLPDHCAMYYWKNSKSKWRAAIIINNEKQIKNKRLNRSMYSS
jgi:hypothetical protein